MNEIICKLDDREHALIELYNNDLETNKIVWEIKRMNLGDIKLKWYNESIIIERKTIEDLMASQNDGRYSEQKVRLLAKQNAKIYYILEGKIPKEHLKRVKGTILHMSMRDNINVIRTANIIDTYTFIKNMAIFAKKLFATDETFHLLTGSGKNEYTIKSVKKKNMTPLRCYINMLACIPGVSEKKAISISKQFPNMIELIKFMKENGSKCLSGQCALIGKKISEKIYEYLINN